MRIPLILSLVPFCPVVADPVPGAWEGFPGAANAGAWSVNDFRTGTVSAVQWLSPETGFVAKALNGVPGVPCGIWFFTAGEEFTGDYGQAKIRGIRLRYFATSEELGEMDCVIHASGPAGSTFYYSESVAGAGLSAGGAWRDAGFLFDTDWYFVEDGGFRPTPVTAQMLATISEIGFRFIPKPGITTVTSAGIDDVVLIPTVEAPGIVPGAGGGNFTMEITPRPGTVCSIEKSATDDLGDWQAVPGQAGLKGPATHLYATPRSTPKAFFRVVAEERLTPVAAP